MRRLNYIMENFSDFLNSPWPWYVVGPIMGLTVPFLLLVGSKHFGISSSLRHICAAVIPGKIKFFNYNWRKEIWNLIFVVGLILGSFIAANFMNNGEPVQVSEHTKMQLSTYGITEADYAKLNPESIFGVDKIFTGYGLVFMVIGGFLVGFGTRYAAGCTTGHSITGMANLQLPSLIATMCFMAGGFITSVLLMPYIMDLLNN